MPKSEIIPNSLALIHLTSIHSVMKIEFKLIWPFPAWSFVLQCQPSLCWCDLHSSHLPARFRCKGTFPSTCDPNLFRFVSLLWVFLTFCLVWHHTHLSAYLTPPPTYIHTNMHTNTHTLITSLWTESRFSLSLLSQPHLCRAVLHTCKYSIYVLNEPVSRDI